MRYRAKVAYDGTAYEGFQRQRSPSRTIQAALEGALGRVSGTTVTVIGAGRTDAGVHASGQVIAFDLNWRHTLEALCRAINANLPEDIAVVRVEEAAPDFHPRYDATSREYEYRLVVAPTRDPLRRWRAWHVTTPLDVVAMQEASESLLGAHDFSAFGTPPKGDNPVRTVFQAVWASYGDELRFTISADAFLYRMVRRVVGTLVNVGRRRMAAHEFRAILAARDRKRAAPPAPAHGLTLVAVKYPETE